MARYTYNCDKWDCESGSLYNSVISVVFSNEGTEPVTVAEAKAWGKIDQDTDDDLIEDLITAAREILEDFTGLGFITRTIEAVINNVDGGLKLPYGPVTSDPTAVDNVDTAVDFTYELGTVETLGRMKVTYQGGYATLPKKFKSAIKQQFLFMYENRGESNIGLSPIAEYIMSRYRQVV